MPQASRAAGAPPAPRKEPLTGWRMRDDNPNEWIWTPRVQRRHDLSTWLTVDLPESVQEALWCAGQIQHPYRDLNSRDAEWVEHRDWVFGLDFDASPPPASRRIFIEFESVAGECMLYLNGAPIGKHEGNGASFYFEIGRHLQAEGNQLFLVVRAPYQEDPQTGWTDRTRSLRGRMGFGWDFAPRLVALGVLGDVTLRHTGRHKLRDLWARPTLSHDLSAASVDLSVRLDGEAGAEVRFTVTQDGSEIASVTASAGEDGVAHAQVELPHPQIWWPNGMGAQPLYAVRADCTDWSDSVSSTFGLRNIGWEVRPGEALGEWPLTLVVNGKRVFQRGWNWVPADCMGGPRSLPRMQRLISMARAAHTNVLRCWGGADPETEAFYNECDRHGILVWQEFPLSSSGISNLPPDDPDYLNRMAAYARKVVAERRNHPSLALWGGGNELSGVDGKPLTLDHPYARQLHEVLQECDPDRTFRPGSPLGPTADADPEQPVQWDVHGPWEYSQRWPGPQYWRVNAIEPALHSETGAPGMASVDTQRFYLSPPHRRRDPSNPAWGHHGGAWWDHRSTVEHLFGVIEDDELAVLASQWLQAETLRYFIEETRRRWPRSAGIYPWQLNEPWPNVVCTSAVEYSGRPKLGYFAVRNAYRPVIPTAHYDGLTIEPDDPLRAEVWALNEGDAVEQELVVTLTDLTGLELVERSAHRVLLPENESIKVVDLQIALPSGFAGVVMLKLAFPGAANHYLFSNAARPPLQAALGFPQLLRSMFPTVRTVTRRQPTGGIE
ncbi:MAG: glycoside hydrolase family 2 TIM barrel-domain containing protein [Chloroflexota bacterium]